jgi:hypothetical protein
LCPIVASRAGIAQPSGLGFHRLSDVEGIEAVPAPGGPEPTQIGAAHISAESAYRDADLGERRRQKLAISHPTIVLNSNGAERARNPNGKTKAPFYSRKSSIEMRLLQARIADLWCRFMHTEPPMWPSHGRYECRTCGRRHRVCWMILPRETRAASAAETARKSTIPCS